MKKPSSCIQDDLQAEQFQILRTQIPTMYVALLINTAILSFSVYDAVPVALSIGVPTMFAVLVFVRMGIWLTRKQTAPTKERISGYLRSTTCVAALVSLGLGLWGVALLRSELHDKTFVPMFIAFGAIACTYCLGCLPRAAFATVFLSVTPVSFALLAEGEPIDIAAGLSLLLIFPLVLRLVMHQNSSLIERVSSHAQVKALAFTDSLTGLPNRRTFTESLEDHFERAAAGPMTPAVAVIDLDGFKAINDTFGHPVGDAVLTQAAERLRAACSECQLVSRLGGDEFAVLLMVDENGRPLTDIATNLVQEMSKPFMVSGSQLHLSASIGMARHLPDDASPLAVMSRADMALYEVKRMGGGGVLWAVPAMATRLRRRMIIEQSLRETSPRPRIEVVYQPIFDVRSKQVVSFEALARWNHPVLGSIPPLEFIETAEQTGTIEVLSAQIFDTAIAQAANWASPIGLSINLSAVDLCRPGTPLMILSLCHRHGLDPRRLEVEVTETSVLSDFDAARNQLNYLRASGVRVALDDFGSGFASISYLKEMKFDRVKIDGELIADIIQSREARRLVQGILQLCSAIDMPVTAEKVESREQLEVLTGLGCDRIQGYLLGTPITADGASALADLELQVA